MPAGRGKPRAKLIRRQAVSLALLRDPETPVRQARGREVGGSREGGVRPLSEVPPPAIPLGYFRFLGRKNEAQIKANSSNIESIRHVFNFISFERFIGKNQVMFFQEIKIWATKLGERCVLLSVTPLPQSRLTTKDF